METVLLYGADEEGKIRDTLLAALRAASPEVGVLHMAPKSLAMFPPEAQTPGFLVVEDAPMAYIRMPRGVAVLCPGVTTRRGSRIPSGFCAVVDPGSEGAIRLLLKNGVETVTCGLSPKDTITFSSIGQEHAVVALQRGLRTLDGSIAEPAELPIRFEARHTGFGLLASVAVLLLLGCPPRDGFYME